MIKTRKKAKRNPPIETLASLKKRAVVIYPKLLEIRAEKPNGQAYKHSFEGGPTVRILGLPDGSLLIPARGQRLWGTA